MKHLALASLIALSFASPLRSLAQVAPVPTLMNFQGRLANPDGTPVADGTYSIRFSLWDSLADGTEQWNQTIDSITVRNGTFATLLTVDTAGLFNNDLWLEIKIGANDPLSPRQRLVSVAYAMKASTVADGAVTGASIADGSITDSKIVSLDWSKIINAPASSFTLPYVGVHTDPNTAAFTLTAPKNAIIAYGKTLNAPTIYAENSASGSIGYFTGNNVGAYGSSPRGAGVYGTSSGGNGVEGHTNLSYNAGVFGSADTNLAYGVAGRHLATQNVGYLGLANTAIYGDAINANSNGVWGHANNGQSGVIGVNDSTGSGVYGVSARGSGVFGQSNSSGSAGGYFTNTAGGLALLVNGSAQMKTLQLTGADLAEKFEMAGKVRPGMVVEIDPNRGGQLRLAHGAYSRLVAGVVSGAGKLPAGVTLTAPKSGANAQPVALSGRVWVWCDATKRAILPGNLMTTSSRPGYAMATGSRSRSMGATLGKAMTGLAKGKTGLVLVLVNLQ